jgi:hypothetical protein
MSDHLSGIVNLTSFITNKYKLLLFVFTKYNTYQNKTPSAYLMQHI